MGRRNWSSRGSWGNRRNWGNGRSLRLGDGLVLSGVSGWDNTWSSDGQGGSLRHSDGGWGTSVSVTGGDGDHGGLWAVGGVTGDSDVGGDNGGVRVSGHGGGGEGGQSGDGGELHF